MKEIYQIKINLKDIRPEIWRRLLIHSDLLLSQLHIIIQVSMGWSDDHLHQFIKNKKFYSPDSEDEYFNDLHEEGYETLKIEDLLTKKRDKILYEYDFGDSWIHEIVLEKILPVDDQIKYPLCIDGARNCPPEDCGGIGGYFYYLKILKDPNHPEYEDIKEWMGEDFDPEYFDKEEINNYFQSDDFRNPDFED